MVGAVLPVLRIVSCAIISPFVNLVTTIIIYTQINVITARPT